MSAGVAARSRFDAAPDASAQAGSRRFYDSAAASWMVKVFPGEFYVTTSANELIVTVLGSCVAACIRDPVVGIGGMNHFMLARGHSGSWGDDPRSTRFGNFAMEKLINELLKRGCARDRLEIKVFGGGNVIDSSNTIGTDNADFVLRYLEAEGLPCAAHDLGGSYARRIQYDPSTGRVVRRLLGTTERSLVVREEIEYAEGLRARPASGEIHLFGNFG